MRIAILLYEPSDKEVSYFNNLLTRLNDAGHLAFFAKKTLTELKMDVARVKNFVGKTEADAWVVVAGSKPVLEWFEQQNFPAFALFGRSVNVNLAATAPLKGPALIEAVRHLVALGHQRIVMLAREERRKPLPGLLEQTFLDELEAQGIKTGPYNLPDWEECPGRLQEALNQLFKHTPPTALFIQTSQLTIAILQHVSELGLKIPRDLSIISMDPSPAYELCHPLISHISYDSDPWLRRIVRWANNVARGKEDRKRVLFPGKFVAGGTTGPAK